jgi:[NiFe] hydrogenase maturation protein HypF
MTLSIFVLGVVQGVGYRPFVARLAAQLGVTGAVRNNGGVVEITASAKQQAMENFLHRLKSQQPPGADVMRVLSEPVPEQAFDGFRIIPSSADSGETPLIPPDLPLCEDCLKELETPSDRRYRYPFISCVACGPRYSILESLPYDRCDITMDDFPMCGQCKEEYTTETRRRHAQTISCHDCGPQLIFQAGGEVLHREEALQKGIALLQNGAVLALKGIGGYQFACLPGDAAAVERLRRLKHRDKKPFAVMFPSMESIRAVCAVSEEEEKLLCSPARPIVLLGKRQDAFCAGVSSESRFLGAFLPYTGLHQLLTEACGPLVMTSGNLTNEPILIRDGDMLALQSEFLDGVLYHTRRIVTPLDDSVARVVGGEPQLIRRSRGYVPAPLWLEHPAEQSVLAMGGDLKACFCLMKGDRAYLSQYFGDMEEYAVEQVYRENMDRMERIFGIAPSVIACDLHPGYQTVRIAEQTGLPLVRIQHHYAHIASVMAEHRLDSCIGAAFDGTGYGTDGCVWGGEFLLCSGNGFERVAHLGYVPLCGGDAASKDAELTALCYLLAADEQPDDRRLALVKAAVESRVNVSQSSSMGRLFDAVSAVLGIRKYNTYEGECAVALENAAAAALAVGVEPYPLDFETAENCGIIELDQIGLVKKIARAAADGIDAGSLALGFHLAAARAIQAVFHRIRQRCGENAAALSGGVFANRLLTEECIRLLKADGFRVYLNSAVPCGDSGICLGQAWAAAVAGRH